MSGHRQHVISNQQGLFREGNTGVGGRVGVGVKIRADVRITVSVRDSSRVTVRVRYRVRLKLTDGPGGGLAGCCWGSLTQPEPYVYPRPWSASDFCVYVHPCPFTSSDPDPYIRVYTPTLCL